MIKKLLVVAVLAIGVSFTAENANAGGCHSHRLHRQAGYVPYVAPVRSYSYRPLYYAPYRGYSAYRPSLSIGIGTPYRGLYGSGYRGYGLDSYGIGGYGIGNYGIGGLGYRGIGW